VELIGYLRLLRRRWWIVLLAIIVCVGAAIGGTRVEHKRYTSTTRLLVSGSSSLSAVDEITRRQLAEQRATLFSQIATTDPVVRAALAQATRDNSAANIPGAAASVSASATGNDPFLTIKVTADVPAAAQTIANAYVKILPTQLATLDQLPSVVDTLLTVVNPAGLPTTPSSPRPLRNALIGLALGTVLGIAGALIRETLDTTLRDSDEVRRMTRTTILGVIPREFPDEKLPAATRAHSRRSEAYRQVRTNLEFAAEESPPRSYTITSPGQGEGKSTIAANLAVLTSRAGKRVAVVDADLRKPTLASFFNADGSRGLAEVLAGRAQLPDVLQHIAGENITVLASGRSVANPSELLGSQAMEDVLLELQSVFDIVIVDSAPVLAVTDALLVGKHTDGMIVVTRMRSTTRSALRRSIEAVERVHARLLGIIVNVAVEAEDKRYGYGKGYISGDKSSAGSDIRPVSGHANNVDIDRPIPAHAAPTAAPPAPPPLQQPPPPQLMDAPTTTSYGPATAYGPPEPDADDPSLDAPAPPHSDWSPSSRAPFRAWDTRDD